MSKLPPLSLADYVRAVDQLAHGEGELEARLLALGLTPEEFEQADEYWQAELDGEVSEEGRPGPLLAEYLRLLEHHHDRHPESSVSLETWLAILRGVASGEELTALLRLHQLSVEEFCRCQRDMTRRLAQDPKLARRVSELLSGQSRLERS